jgi:hypothetical protein
MSKRNAGSSKYKILQHNIDIIYVWKLFSYKICICNLQYNLQRGLVEISLRTL